MVAAALGCRMHIYLPCTLYVCLFEMHPVRVRLFADFKNVGSFSLCRKPDRVTHYKRTQLMAQLVHVVSSSITDSFFSVHFKLYLTDAWPYSALMVVHRGQPSYKDQVHHTDTTTKPQYFSHGVTPH